MSNILYGICGIGSGHFYRQIPILEELIAQEHKIMVFTYGEIYQKLHQIFGQKNNVKIVEVWNPYLIGDINGINFQLSFEHPHNHSTHHLKNIYSFELAKQWLGKPNLVISDYECCSAQYAYMMEAPLITIDQQSKFFGNPFSSPLNGCGYQDEIERLNLFFPKVENRIYCSFFKTEHTEQYQQIAIPPILREELNTLCNNPIGEHYLVYKTSQEGFEQSLQNWIDLLKDRPENYHIFCSPEQLKSIPYIDYQSNIHFYQQGDKHFEALLSFCSGIITTAGHSLISEAMHLQIPVLAIPLKLYEQQLSAKIIQDNAFGLSHSVLNSEILENFIKHHQHFKSNIEKDTQVLLKGNGKTEILKIIKPYLKNI